MKRSRLWPVVALTVCITGLIVAGVSLGGAGGNLGWSLWSSTSSQAATTSAALEAVSARGAERVEVVPKQSAGDSAQWTLREVRSERVGDGEVSTSVTTRRGTIRVLDADEKIVVMSWSESAWWDVDDDDTDNAADIVAEGSINREIRPSLAGSVVEMVVSRDGQIMSLRNTDELRTSVIAGIDAQARLLAARTGDAEAAEIRAAIARNMLDSPGLLRAVVMRDVSPYFFGYGWKLGVGEVLRFEDSMPNDFGSQPLPVLASCVVNRAVADGDDAYTVVFSQETDPVRVPEIMRRSVDEVRAMNREVARAAGVDGIDNDSDDGVETVAFEFSISDNAVYEYDARSGWILRAQWARRSVAGDVVRTTVNTWDVTPTMMVDVAQESGAAAQERGMDRKTQFATFGAGCFWGVEVTFRNVPGVVDAAVGYTGGSVSNPTYKQVCTGATGHAEVVHVEFDPAVVGYDKLLEVFFRNHNPTTLNRQGPDIGTQYRSAVFYHSPEQKAEAERVMARMQSEFRSSGRFGGRAIVTTLEPFEKFYRAEEYHQRYLEKRGLATCSTSDE